MLRLYLYTLHVAIAIGISERKEEMKCVKDIYYNNELNTSIIMNIKHDNKRKNNCILQQQQPSNVHSNDAK